MIELAWQLFVIAILVWWYEKGRYYNDQSKREPDLYTGVLLGSVVSDHGPSDVRDSGQSNWDSGRIEPLDGNSVWEFGSVWGSPDQIISRRISDPDSPTTAYPAPGSPAIGGVGGPTWDDYQRTRMVDY